MDNDNLYGGILLHNLGCIMGNRVTWIKNCCNLG